MRRNSDSSLNQGVGRTGTFPLEWRGGLTRCRCIRHAIFICLFLSLVPDLWPQGSNCTTKHKRSHPEMPILHTPESDSLYQCYKTVPTAVLINSTFSPMVLCLGSSKWVKQNPFLLFACLHFKPHYINVFKIELSSLGDIRAKASLC